MAMWMRYCCKKIHHHVWDTLILLTVCCIIKMHDFQGELIHTSAETKLLNITRPDLVQAVNRLP